MITKVRLIVAKTHQFSATKRNTSWSEQFPHDACCMGSRHSENIPYALDTVLGCLGRLTVSVWPYNRNARRSSIGNLGMPRLACSPAVCMQQGMYHDYQKNNRIPMNRHLRRKCIYFLSEYYKMGKAVTPTGRQVTAVLILERWTISRLSK